MLPLGTALWRDGLTCSCSGNSGLAYHLAKIEHSFDSHVTNEEIYAKANIILNNGEDLNIDWQEFIRAKDYSEIKYIEKLSDYVMRQQNKLFGHIIRSERFDLVRQPALDNDMKQPHQLNRRVGKPRMGWISENCKYVYSKYLQQDYDEKTRPC